MPQPQTIIAVNFDFDLTLTPEYMQVPLFRKYGLDIEELNEGVDAFKAQAATQGVNTDSECAYMNFILRKVRDGTFPNLSNQKLKELGAEIKFYPGLPEFLPHLRDKIQTSPKYQEHGIKVEFYVISTGMRPMVEGSKVGPYLDGVFASEFLEDEHGVISEIARAVGHMKKTEFVHIINKGANKNTNINVNGVLPKPERRIPFDQMLYICDGPTDVPVCATINDRGGKSIAVYNEAEARVYHHAMLLQQQGRVFTFVPANFVPENHTTRTLEYVVTEMADRIAARKETEARGNVSEVPAP